MALVAEHRTESRTTTHPGRISPSLGLHVIVWAFTSPTTISLLACHELRGLLMRRWCRLGIDNLGVDRLSPTVVASTLCFPQSAVRISCSAAGSRSSTHRTLRPRSSGPRSMPTSPVPHVSLVATSTCRLRYHRPLASWAKLPHLISPSTGRLFQKRYRCLRWITASPSILIARAAANGIQPRDFLPRQRGGVCGADRDC